MVTPCVGVWIEIDDNTQCNTSKEVTPCVGVWIEISLFDSYVSPLASLPAWECGLKSINPFSESSRSCVTPCVGVWIEIPYGANSQMVRQCHSLRGSVD